MGDVIVWTAMGIALLISVGQIIASIFDKSEKKPKPHGHSDIADAYDCGVCSPRPTRRQQQTEYESQLIRDRLYGPRWGTEPLSAKSKEIALHKTQAEYQRLIQMTPLQNAEARSKEVADRLYREQEWARQHYQRQVQMGLMTTEQATMAYRNALTQGRTPEYISAEEYTRRLIQALTDKQSVEMAFKQRRSPCSHDERVDVCQGTTRPGTVSVGLRQACRHGCMVLNERGSRVRLLLSGERDRPHHSLPDAGPTRLPVRAPACDARREGLPTLCPWPVATTPELGELQRAQPAVYDEPAPVLPACQYCGEITDGPPRSLYVHSRGWCR